MAISSSGTPRAAQLSIVQKKKEILEVRSRSLEPGNEKEQAKAMKAVEREQQRLESKLNLTMLLGILLALTIWVAFARAWMEEDKLFWLLYVPEIPKNITDFSAVLAPLLAISVAIERLLETAFNWYEQSVRTVADILVAPRETLDWIGKEYQEAYDATEAAAQTIGVVPSEESLTIFEMSENRLAQAEERLRSWTGAPEYLAWKKALCIWFGLLIGLIVSVLGDLKMLNYIGIPAPRFIDMMITGLVIGSGPGPMHDLIGILQGGRNALGSLADLAKGNTVRAELQALRNAEALRRDDIA